MARIEHTETQSVVVESRVSASSHAVVEELPMCQEELPIIGENSALSENQVSMDSVNDYSSDSDDSDKEEPTFEYLLTSLRFWASTFSVSLVALTALLTSLRVFHPKIAQRC